MLAARNLSRFPLAENVELLRRVRAVEDDEVTARAALDQVPATLAVDRVVAAAAEQPLGCGAAAQQVVAGVTEEARRLRVGEDAEALVDRERVGAGCAVHDDPVEGGAIEGELSDTVGAHVHLESGAAARLQPQRDFLALRRAEDVERPRRTPASTFGFLLRRLLAGGLASAAPYAAETPRT